MKENKNNGGSAFPFSVDVDGTKAINIGLSIRDYFAAKAMQGFLANNVTVEQILRYSPIDEKACDTYSDFAYEIADSMLSRREKQV